MRVVYVAHPVGAQTQEEVVANVQRAKRWYHWMCENYDDEAFVANWIVDVEVYSGTDVGAQRHTNPARIQGLKRDDAVIEVCHAMILCGGWISSGMARGVATATRAGLKIYNLTALGLEPPEGRIDLEEYVMNAA